MLRNDFLNIKEMGYCRKVNLAQYDILYYPLETIKRAEALIYFQKCISKMSSGHLNQDISKSRSTKNELILKVFKTLNYAKKRTNFDTIYGFKIK